MLEEIIIALISWKTAILIVPWDTAKTVFIHYASCGKVHIRLELCRIPNSPFPTVDLLEKLSRNSSSFKLGYTLHAQLYIYIYTFFFSDSFNLIFFLFITAKFLKQTKRYQFFWFISCDSTNIEYTYLRTLSYINITWIP